MIWRKMEKVTLSMAVVTLLFTGVQCSLQNPVAPSWEADLNIPLMQNKTFIGDFLSGKAGSKDDPLLTISLDESRVTGGIIGTDVSAIKGMVSGGVIDYELENRLAIGLDTAMIFISRDSGTVYQTPEIVLGPLKVEAAETDTSGNVLKTRTTRISIPVGEKEMEILGNSNGVLFVGYYLVTSGTNGATVNIQATDYLKTSVMVTAKTRIN